MKPISLHGHEKSITQIKYNREGDLLFSCAKDRQPNVWYSINGERLGTYDGHGGAVWCLDVDWQTKLFLSGAADNSVRWVKLLDAGAYPIVPLSRQGTVDGSGFYAISSLLYLA